MVRLLPQTLQLLVDEFAVSDVLYGLTIDILGDIIVFQL